MEDLESKGKAERISQNYMQMAIEEDLESKGKTEKTHQDYMQMALDLARQGAGKVSPNPMVGCVVVKDGRVIATGCHQEHGGFHAERNALLHCEENPEGAELYVNLEPCCHYGKTPPCTEIILEKKIRKVYVGCLDPNPKVAGNGIKILKEHGVQVEVGILQEECLALNEVFFHYIKNQMPFVALKYAMTLDGKIACETGDSKWVTGQEARDYVQSLRNRYRGIMVGIGTVLADDPLLNCRMEGGKDPIRIVCDARLSMPFNSQIVKTAAKIETILAWNPHAAEEFRINQKFGMPKELKNSRQTVNPMQDKMPLSVEDTKNYLESKGVTLLEIPLKDAGSFPQLDVRQLLCQLGARKIDSILLEGGGTLNASILQEGLLQRVYAFVSPKLVAGAKAKSPVEGKGILYMKDAVELKEIEISSFGKDICITGRIGKEEICLPES